MGNMWRLNILTGILLIQIAIGVSCKSKNENSKADKDMAQIIKDPHSFSKPEEAVVKHLNLNLEIDFDLKKIKGVAELEIEKQPGIEKIILDTKELHIHEVRYADGEKADFILHEEDPFL